MACKGYGITECVKGRASFGFLCTFLCFWVGAPECIKGNRMRATSCPKQLGRRQDLMRDARITMQGGLQTLQDGTAWKKHILENMSDEELQVNGVAHMKIAPCGPNLIKCFDDRFALKKKLQKRIDCRMPGGLCSLPYSSCSLCTTSSNSSSRLSTYLMGE